MRHYLHEFGQKNTVLRWKLAPSNYIRWGTLFTSIANEEKADFRYSLWQKNDLCLWVQAIAEDCFLSNFLQYNSLWILPFPSECLMEGQDKWAALGTLHSLCLFFLFMLVCYIIFQSGYNVKAHLHHIKYPNIFAAHKSPPKMANDIITFRWGSRHNLEHCIFKVFHYKS